MRIGIATWKNRISPVLDVAERMAIIDIQEEHVEHRGDLLLSMSDPYIRVREILTASVELVICGAISGMLFQMLRNAGIEVICWVSGDMDDVLTAYLNGEPLQEQFAMPGCRGCAYGKRNRHRRGRGAEDPPLRPDPCIHVPCPRAG